MYQLPVGTDLSRPLGLFNRRQGRDKSVPTLDPYIRRIDNGKEKTHI